jgi:hypothetical protein
MALKFDSCLKTTAPTPALKHESGKSLGLSVDSRGVGVLSADG